MPYNVSQIFNQSILKKEDEKERVCEEIEEVEEAETRSEYKLRERKRVTDTQKEKG